MWARACIQTIYGLRELYEVIKKVLRWKYMRKIVLPLDALRKPVETETRKLKIVIKTFLVVISLLKIFPNMPYFQLPEVVFEEV